MKNLFTKLFFSVLFLMFLIHSTTCANVYYDGIDISHYQGTVDFSEVATTRQAVYIKAGEGSDYVDSQFSENHQGATAAGLDYGFYYYVTATSTTEAINQAIAFSDLITGIDYTLRPAMDFESFSTLSTTEINAIALAFLTKLEELTGVVPAIYSDAYNVETVWSATLSDYPLWVAAYEDLSTPQDYELPDNDVWTSWSGYQYSDSTQISGISGNVDSDIFTTALFLSDTTDTSDSDSDTSDSSDSDTSSTSKTSITYTVKKGDTLWGISQKYDVSITNLVTTNGIANPDFIAIDEVLKIPISQTYIVQSGDTLFGIANAFQTSVSALATTNQISNINLIYVGEVLQIP